MTSFINASTSAGLVQTADTSGSLALQTASTTAVTIDTSQNVGIGVTPTVKLDIAGTTKVNTTGGNSQLQVGDTASGTYSTLRMYGGSGKYNFQLGVQNNVNNAFEITPSTAAGGTTFSTPAMVIDSSGNVGIGTTSPTATGGYDKAIDLVGGSNGAGLYIRGATNPSTVYAAIRYDNGANRTNIDAVGTGNFLRFVTVDTERARIDSSGNLLVGGTSRNGTGRVEIKCTNGVDNGLVCYTTASGGATGTLVYFLYNNTTFVGSITSAGSSTSYGSISDYRLKENVQPMTGALAKVAQLKPCTYKWKSDGSDGQGFIAHELQAVVPDAVVGGKDAVDIDENPIYQNVDTSFLVATLTAAIQELKAINDTQAETINALTARIVALEAK
jgi:hypothetical protein